VAGGGRRRQPAAAEPRRERSAGGGNHADPLRGSQAANHGVSGVQNLEPVINFIPLDAEA